jgi:hypothetical protein
MGSHGNLHLGNILVSTVGEETKFWIIDFGRSTVIPLGMTERNVFRSRIKKTNRRGGVNVYDGGRRMNTNMLRTY